MATMPTAAPKKIPRKVQRRAIMLAAGRKNTGRQWTKLRKLRKRGLA